jgi:hypothetical protein
VPTSRVIQFVPRSPTLRVRPDRRRVPRLPALVQEKSDLRAALDAHDAAALALQAQDAAGTLLEEP